MFHIKSLELVHWDYWQRIKNIPLDAKIITIAGQNGSGKTTLLDALRTLFGLDCSMGRTYKHYARHSGQQTAWLRAVVDNRNVGKQLSNRPFRSSGFFSDDEVTLFCQIQKNGGDWKRQYLMRPGNVQIEDISDANDWLGVENYRKRLANAGLSPAMSKVLALEQGETDKLCEYAPRQLLDLVFQVFGDKEVLDAYDEAKRHQRDTEVELKRFETELEASKTNLEGLRLRVANYHQWEGLHRERRNLLEEVLPSLQYHEAREKAATVSRQLRDARKPMALERPATERQAQCAGGAGESPVRRADERNPAGAGVDWPAEPPWADQRETETARQPAGTEGAPAKAGGGLGQRYRRRCRPAGTAGSGLAAAAPAARRAVGAHCRRAGDDRRAAGQDGHAGAGQCARHAPRAARRGYRPRHAVRYRRSDGQPLAGRRRRRTWAAMRRWCCSTRPRMAAAAYRLAEKERYRHFIVPELVTAPSAKDDSLLAVVKFSAPVPSWLIEQLSRIARVDSVEAGFKLGNHDEWITPEAYHRERRGGRSLFVEASRYRFGQAGRSGRLEALLRSLPGLEAQEDTLTLAISKLAAEVGNSESAHRRRRRGQGTQRAPGRIRRSAAQFEPLKEERLAVGGRLGELQNLTKNATVARTRADTVWQNARLALSEAEAGSRLGYKKQIEQRADHARALLALRRAWRHLPRSWRRPARRAALVAEHQNAHQVDLRVSSLQCSLARDDWELDATVIDQHHRLSEQLSGRQSETDERRYQNNRAIEATGNARGAYMERLRYTIKTYSKNIKELGELAGIEVHADPVRLENDDVQLSQAGLHVRFKFDGKGIIGMNDGEASGGQQVMKSLVLLIGLLKSEGGSGGFVFIDEPFAHLDIRNIQLVGEFLKNTEAQYLMTTPLTHNTDVYDPSELTLITSKKKKDTQWAQPIFVLQRRQEPAAGKVA